jgi:hypothetical protein
MAKHTENVPAVKEEAGALAVVDFGADAGDGFEGMDQDCFAIPYLVVLQKTSPQCDDMSGKFIDGARPGDLYNTVTGKIYKGKDGVEVIPCGFTHKYNLWAPNRGGFHGFVTPAEYLTMNKEKRTNDKGKVEEVDVDGNIITNTMEHYVTIVNSDGTTEPALFTMTSTQLKKSKAWNTMSQAICGKTKPSYSQVYRVTTVPESNDFGSWAGIKIDHSHQITDITQYEAAKDFAKMVKTGEAKASSLDNDDLPY